ncbi:MAG: alkaline shock response membrane anchor protein AmaP [Opitutae bacterium]|jgi:uncharacterized alkaline shock family protein YloU|nr:alkaline shock response membrane anchor protein AmaP [Opitutae bacterium]
MNWTKTIELLNLLTEPTYLYAAGAVITLALFLMLLVRRQPNKIVAYRTENGRVMVCRSAIVELIRTSCEQLDNVAKPIVKIKVKGKATHFDVRIQLKSGGRLRDIEQTLQRHLRQNLTENLGIEHIGQINIVASGFKSGRIQVSSPITGKEQEPSAALEAVAPPEPALTEELGEKPI